MVAAKEKLEIVKSRGEAAPNSRGVPRRLRRRNAFGLIQEYCTMEKLKKSIYKRLPITEIYLDDVDDIFEVIQRHTEREVLIETEDYKLKTTEELRHLGVEKLNNLEIKSIDPYIRVKLEPASAYIYSGRDDTLSRGILDELGLILSRGAKNLQTILVQPYILALYWLIALLCGWWLGSKSSTARIFGFAGVFLLGVLYAIWGSRREQAHSVVILKKRQESSGFLKRNKDQLLIALFGAIIGGIATLLIAILLAGWF